MGDVLRSELEGLSNARLRQRAATEGVPVAPTAEETIRAIIDKITNPPEPEPTPEPAPISTPKLATPVEPPAPVQEEDREWTFPEIGKVLAGEHKADPATPEITDAHLSWTAKMAGMILQYDHEVSEHAGLVPMEPEDLKIVTVPMSGSRLLAKSTFYVPGDGVDVRVGQVVSADGGAQGTVTKPKIARRRKISRL